MATQVTAGKVERKAGGGMRKWAIGAGVVAAAAAVALGAAQLTGTLGGSRQSNQSAVSAPASVQNQTATNRQPTHGALAEDVPSIPVAESRPSTHGALADDGVAGQTFGSDSSAGPAPITHGRLP